jgi:hypothetical protein
MAYYLSSDKIDFEKNVNSLFALKTTIEDYEMDDLMKRRRGRRGGKREGNGGREEERRRESESERKEKTKGGCRTGREGEERIIIRRSEMRGGLLSAKVGRRKERDERGRNFSRDNNDSYCNDIGNKNNGNNFYCSDYNDNGLGRGRRYCFSAEDNLKRRRNKNIFVMREKEEEEEEGLYRNKGKMNEVMKNDVLYLNNDGMTSFSLDEKRSEKD